MDSLRTKLFLLIAAANMLLILLAYAIFNWSFERSMLEYLNRVDDRRLAPLVQRLGDEYAARGSWQWMRGNADTLGVLLHETLGLSAYPPHESPQNPRGIHPGKPLWIEDRLFLLDADRTVVIGPVNRNGAWLTPISSGGQVVGYLGRTPRRDLVAELDQTVAQRQKQQYALIALALLVAVALNAALIARWLAAKLAPLDAGARAVAGGDYSVRIRTVGRDEMAQLGHSFNSMAAALEAAKQSRQRWVADIAHELRTPLATLQAEIEALQDGVRTLDAARMASLLQEVARLTRLVNDLRTLSLADMGALDYRMETQDLGEWLADYLHDARTGLPQDAQLDTALQPALLIRMDADRMAQVVSNLMQNTLRYTHPPVRLRVSLVRQGDEACLVWEDSAPGVAEEARAHLTDRLYRAESSRARSEGGSGLGLSIACAIVQGHQGRMLATHSRLGGLRWDIFLPLVLEVPNA